LMDSIIREDIEQIKRSIDVEAFRGKSVLVSGGSGFLGSWICDVLSQVGSRIICLDNLSTGVFENVEHLKGTKGFEFEKAMFAPTLKARKLTLSFILRVGRRLRITRNILWKRPWPTPRGRTGCWIWRGRMMRGCSILPQARSTGTRRSSYTRIL